MTIMKAKQALHQLVLLFGLSHNIFATPIFPLALGGTSLKSRGPTSPTQNTALDDNAYQYTFIETGHHLGQVKAWSNMLWATISEGRKDPEGIVPSEVTYNSPGQFQPIRLKVVAGKQLRRKDFIHFLSQTLKYLTANPSNDAKIQAQLSSAGSLVATIDVGDPDSFFKSLGNSSLEANTSHLTSNKTTTNDLTERVPSSSLSVQVQSRKGLGLSIPLASNIYLLTSLVEAYATKPNTRPNSPVSYQEVQSGGFFLAASNMVPGASQANAFTVDNLYDVVWSTLNRILDSMSRGGFLPVSTSSMRLYKATAVAGGTAIGMMDLSNKSHGLQASKM